MRPLFPATGCFGITLLAVLRRKRLLGQIPSLVQFFRARLEIGLRIRNAFLDFNPGVLRSCLRLRAQRIQLHLGFLILQFDGRFCPLLYRAELLLHVRDVFQKGFSIDHRRLIELVLQSFERFLQRPLLAEQLIVHQIGAKASEDRAALLRQLLLKRRNPVLLDFGQHCSLADIKRLADVVEELQIDAMAASISQKTKIAAKRGPDRGAGRASEDSNDPAHQQSKAGS